MTDGADGEVRAIRRAPMSPALNIGHRPVLPDVVDLGPPGHIIAYGGRWCRPGPPPPPPDGWEWLREQWRAQRTRREA